MSAICDRNPEIRYEAIELFRLSLIISVSRETSDQTNNIENRSRRGSNASSVSSLSVNRNGCVSWAHINKTKPKKKNNTGHKQFCTQGWW